METLTALKTSYLETKRVATEDLSDVPSRVRVGRESAKQTAQANLENILDRYAEQLRQSAFTIFVTGNGSEEFARIAAAEGPAIVVDAMALYKKFAEAIEPTFGSKRQFGVTQLGVLLQEMRFVGQDLRLREIDAPRGIDTAIVKDQEANQIFVKNLIESVPSDINLPYMERLVLDAAISNEFSWPGTVPVVVLNAALDIDKIGPKFLGGQFTSVNTTTETVTREQVISTFVSISKALSKKASN